MTTAPDIEQAILDRLAAGVHQRLANLPAEEAAQVDPDWVAAAMLEAIPTQHPFAALGPFYDTQDWSAGSGSPARRCTRR